MGITAQDPYLQIVGPSMNEEPYGIGLPQGSDAKAFVSLQDSGDDAILRFGDDVYVFKGIDAADFY